MSRSSSPRWCACRAPPPWQAQRRHQRPSSPLPRLTPRAPTAPPDGACPCPSAALAAIAPHAERRRARLPGGASCGVQPGVPRSRTYNARARSRAAHGSDAAWWLSAALAAAKAAWAKAAAASRSRASGARSARSTSTAPRSTSTSTARRSTSTSTSTRRAASAAGRGRGQLMAVLPPPRSASWSSSFLLAARWRWRRSTRRLRRRRASAVRR